MEEKLKDLIKKAAEVVTSAEISEDIRPVAFAEVLRYFIQTNVQSVSKVNLLKNVSTKDTSEIPTRKHPSERINSPASLINKMIDNGYFKTKRKSDECQNELKVTGFNVLSKQLATVLLRKVRSGRLKRELTEKGNYVYFSE